MQISLLEVLIFAKPSRDVHQRNVLHGRELRIQRSMTE
jgi:hypothetical protein